MTLVPTSEVIVLTALELFEKVNLRVSLEQRRFFNYLNDTIDELATKYQDVAKLVFTDGGKKKVSELKDDAGVLEAYGPAIVDNIVFLSGGDTTGAAKSEFLRKADMAYLLYWNKNAKGRSVKKGRD